MGELQSPELYRENAERMKARASAAATPAMREEFMRIALMYEVLARRTTALRSENTTG